jgi:hypothetical protein
MNHGESLKVNKCHVCFLTRDVTGSDWSEGQLQDCEDVIKAELDSEVECDASDS